MTLLRLFFWCRAGGVRWTAAGAVFPDFRFPLQPPVLVDHPLEQPLHRGVVERSRVYPLHVRQHFGFARRLVDLEPEELLDPAHFESARRPRAEQPDQQLVEIVDAPPQVVDPRRGVGTFGGACAVAGKRTIRVYSSLFSHPTYSV